MIVNQKSHIDKINLSWEGESLLNSCRLVSLLEILRFHADTFVVIMHTLQLMEGAIYRMYTTPTQSGNVLAPPLTQNSIVPNENSYLKTFANMANQCENLELNSSLKLINNIIKRLSNISLCNLKENIRILREMIETELGERLFIFVSKEKSFWIDKPDLFGLSVSTAFPSATNSIKEAGNCYAIGSHTSCVFHLMRVLEHGLGALAKDVNLTFYRQSWGKIIDKIRDKVDDEIKSLAKQTKDPLRTERLIFLSHAAKEFVYFKDGWRNYAMHGLEEYDAPKALSVLDHVKTFMAHLATKLSE